MPLLWRPPGHAGVDAEAERVQELVGGTCALLRRSEVGCWALLVHDCAQRVRALGELAQEVEGAARAARTESQASLAQFVQDVLGVVEAERRGERVAETQFPTLWEDGPDEDGEGHRGEEEG